MASLSDVAKQDQSELDKKAAAAQQTASDAAKAAAAKRNTATGASDYVWPADQPAGAAGPGGTSPVTGVSIATPDLTTPADVTKADQVAMMSPGQAVEASSPDARPSTAPVAGVAIPNADPNSIANVGGKIYPGLTPKYPDLNLTGGSDPAASSAPAVAAAPKAPPTPGAKPETTADPGIPQMVSKILRGHVNDKSSSFNFGDLLKGAGGALGDFLQRWGMGLMGAPEGKTQGDIQREQAFELQKQKEQATVTAHQQALDNQYQTQRIQLTNQLSMANLPAESAARIKEAIATLDAQYSQELKLIPLRVKEALAQRSMTAAADPGTDFVSQ